MNLKNIKHIAILLLLLFAVSLSAQSRPSNKPVNTAALNPVEAMLERIAPGASDQFITEIVAGPKEYFELDQNGDKVVVRGSNYVAIATGINWYFKYYLNIHLSWNGMTATLPAQLPAVSTPERHETDQQYRYEFNFCTFSYGTPFWDWERWEQEIDWMALHGVNLPLFLTGTETVWRDLLLELGYTLAEVNQFIAGSGFQAWWQMNNLEGWGGPNPDSWYTNQVILGKKILQRYKEFGMEPVMPGYAGMVPSNAAEKLGVNVSNPGEWVTFQRPAFLLPTDNRFAEIADKYYEHMINVFTDNGVAPDFKYFTADPFHEGGDITGVNLPAAGTAIYDAMKRANNNAHWVIQSWHANPRLELINPMNAGEVIVLDLFSDGNPKWRNPGYGKHHWIFTMLHNFGGRSGMFGRLAFIADSYYDAKSDANYGPKMTGVGVAPEGYELDPVMYELLFELPWRNEQVNVSSWLDGYILARYGESHPKLKEAWTYLEKTVYRGRAGQEGTTENVSAARPALDIYSVSSWGSANINYNIYDLRKAAMALLEIAEDFRGNNNFEYDLVNIIQQTLADEAFYLQKEVTAAYRNGDKVAFAELSNRFLELILAQDQLLATRSEFMVGPWLEQAKALGSNEAEKTLYEWNARTIITVWGTKTAANVGGLHDYSYRSWAGLMKDVYYERWKAYFELLGKRLNGETVADIDFFDDFEYPWTIQRNSYPTAATGDAIDIARNVFEQFSSDISVCKPSGTLCVDEGQGYVAKGTSEGAEVELNFSQSERPASVYVDATAHEITVKRGSSFTLNLEGDMKDGHAGVAGYRYFKWTHKFIYADWNNDNQFSSNELLHAIPMNGDNNNAANILKTINVPANAVIGKTILRIRYTNGYSVDINSVSDACMSVTQGGVYDFTLNIIDTDEELTICEPSGTLCSDEGQGFVASAGTTGADVNLVFTQATRPVTVYVDATDHKIEAKRGSSFTLNLEGDMKDGHAGVAGYRYFKWTHKFIYADWNNDKVFDESELLFAIEYNGSDNNAANISKLIQIPEDAVVGELRLRIRYTNGYGTDINSVSDACMDVREGGIYDFTLKVTADGTSVPKLNAAESLFCYPNPASSRLNFSDEVVSALLLDVNGREIANTQSQTMDISSLPNSIYIVKMSGLAGQTNHQLVIKK